MLWAYVSADVPVQKAFTSDSVHLLYHVKKIGELS